MRRKLHTLVPTLDYLADTDLSDKGVSPDQSKGSVGGCGGHWGRIHSPISAGIELLSVGEGSYIMDRDGV